MEVEAGVGAVVQPPVLVLEQEVVEVAVAVAEEEEEGSRSLVEQVVEWVEEH